MSSRGKQSWEGLSVPNRPSCWIRAWSFYRWQQKCQNWWTMHVFDKKSWISFFFISLFSGVAFPYPSSGHLTSMPDPRLRGWNWFHHLKCWHVFYLLLHFPKCIICTFLITGMIISIFVAACLETDNWEISLQVEVQHLYPEATRCLWSYGWPALGLLVYGQSSPLN